MKIKSLLISSLLVFSLTLFAEEAYKVDPEKSEVKWHATKVTGEHYGTVNVATGELQFNDDNLIGGEFRIDMNSITVKDLDPGKWKDKLENHLRSDDFFSVEKFPQSSLKITGIKPAEEGKFKIFADLTIKNITEPVEFVARIDKEKGNAEAEIVVDRAKYDIQYRSGSFFENLGDKLIYDEFKLNVNLVFGK